MNQPSSQQDPEITPQSPQPESGFIDQTQEDQQIRRTEAGERRISDDPDEATEEV